MAGRLPTSSSDRSRRDGRSSSVGEFWVDAEIGKGSFATVYRGYHKASKALVAIKSVDLSRLNPKLRGNLYGEISILKTLRHPHIVALHDCVESSSHINLVMEYCELGDLSIFIKKRDKLGEHPATHDMIRKYPTTVNSGLHEVVARHFLQQLASALKFLRQQNYVHRDVKPQNLLLLPSPRFREASRGSILSGSRDSLIPNAGLASLPMLKLADFGFARVLPSTALAETLCGSPLYMAPEILRYEKYDAKADLWSVGTVLFEMVTGRPPYRARNHVELLRKIEQSEDRIKYPREAVVSKELRTLISKMLTRAPVERMPFEAFFNDPIISGPIPGAVEEDAPQQPTPESKAPELPQQASPQHEAASPIPRRLSLRQRPEEKAPTGSSPREKVASGSPKMDEHAAAQRHQRPPADGMHRMSYSPGQDGGQGLGIRRPPGPQPSSSAPTRSSRMPTTSNTRPPLKSSPSPTASFMNEQAQRAKLRPVPERSMTEQEKAAQDVAFERDYVVVEKKHVEVNAFADEMAANPRLQTSPKSSGPLIRRATQQGRPNSTTGAVRTPPSTAIQTQSRPDDRPAGHERRGSYERTFAGSPGSQPSFIAKAIQDASVRLFGYRVSQQRLSKGQSPPEMYSAFPAYPTPSVPLGLLEAGKQQVVPADDDARAVKAIQDLAHRSDCVYGFGEVKYKQLVPLAPSTQTALGGVPAEEAAEEEDGLTVEAIVALSEEALVLYVKALSLLAKAMDFASIWWNGRNRAESGPSTQDTAKDATFQRANATVQWVRGRFNEVLEKSEIVSLRLIEAQQKLPSDHPSHPSNHGNASISSTTSGTQQVHITPGISAEKLMYERALEMSKHAAIDEIANVDLEGCVLSYVTAIYMLEAVLDNDEDTAALQKRRSSTSGKGPALDDAASDLESDDQQAVKSMIKMIAGRLTVVKKKMATIAEASRSQQAQQQALSRKRSSDATPRSVPSNAS